MKPVVVILVPNAEKRAEVEAALTEHARQKPGAIEMPLPAPSLHKDDAEELPLWRWFSF